MGGDTRFVRFSVLLCITPSVFPPRPGIIFLMISPFSSFMSSSSFAFLNVLPGSGFATPKLLTGWVIAKATALPTTGFCADTEPANKNENNVSNKVVFATLAKQLSVHSLSLNKGLCKNLKAGIWFGLRFL